MEWFSLGIALLARLSDWIRRRDEETVRLVGPTGRLIPPTHHRTGRACCAIGMCLVGLLIPGVFLFGFLCQGAGIVAEFRNTPPGWLALARPPHWIVSYPSLVVVSIAIWLLPHITISAEERARISPWAVTAILLSLVFTVADGPSSKAFNSRISESALEGGRACLDQGEWSEALRRLHIAERLSSPGRENVRVRSYIAGAKYRVESAAVALRYVVDLSSESPDDPSVIRLRDTTRWIVFKLGQELGVQRACDTVTQYNTTYPHLRLSRFWVFLSPVAWASFDQRPCALVDRDYYGDEDFWTAVHWLNSNAGLAVDLARRSSATEDGRDKVLFLLHKWQWVLDQYGASDTSEIIRYCKAREKWLSHDYRRAEELYREFLEFYPSHRWSDDSAYMIAHCREKQGDPVGALIWLSRAGSLPDHDMEKWVRHDSLYISEQYLSADTLLSLLADGRVVSHADLISLAAGQSLIAELRPDEAIAHLTAAARRYADSPFGSMLLQKVGDANVMKRCMAFPAPRRYLKLGRALMNSKTLLYDPAWEKGRCMYLVSAPASYYERWNRYYQAARYLRLFVETVGTSTEAPDAMLDIVRCYSYLSRTAAFWSWNSKPDFRRAAVEWMERLRVQYPSSAAAPAALIECAEMYLHPPEDLRQARGMFLSFVELYPKHHLANNSLNWVAWTQCMEAQKYEPQSTNWVHWYRQAEQTYTRIARDYPKGHVGANARRCRAKIRNEM